MKKFTAALLALVMALCLAACMEEPVKTETVYALTESVREILGVEVRTVYTNNDKGVATGLSVYRDGKLYQSILKRISNGVTYMTITDSEGNESTQMLEYFYDDDGNVTRYDASMNGTTYARVEYVYREDGKLEQATSTTASAVVVTEYTYDESGNAVTKEETTNDGELYTRTDYTYDAQGRLTLEATFDADGVSQGSTAYSYEENGDTVVRTYDADGALTQEETQVHDEHGNVIESTTTIDGEVVEHMTNTYVALEVPVEE